MKLPLLPARRALRAMLRMKCTEAEYAKAEVLARKADRDCVLEVGLTRAMKKKEGK